MTTNPSTPTFYYGCPPDAFAVFKRGDKALCLKDFGNSDWLVSGGPPKGGVVYTVRDYHFGHSATSTGEAVYGQILHLAEVLCDRTPIGHEMGWHHAGFRKVTEEEARAHAAHAQEATP